MSTEQSIPVAADKEPASGQRGEKRGWGGWVAGAALAALALFFIANCRTALDPRVANPNVHGRPRPVKFLFGLDYITFLQISTVIMLLVLLVVFIRGWRRNPGSPVMLMFLCTTLIVWQDPIMNWAPFAVYNPDLIHWPESWPLVSLSPTVEPFVVFGYVTFYFGPYFPAVWILRKLQAKYGPEAFVSRHPLVSLGLLTINALTAADKVIVPVQCEYLSMRGLIQLQNTLAMIRENLNPGVDIEGILPTLVDSRTIHAKEAIEILEENFGDRVFASRIRKTVRFAEAPVKGMSVLKYEPDGVAAQSYRQLAQEVLTNGQR